MAIVLVNGQNGKKDLVVSFSGAYKALVQVTDECKEIAGMFAFFHLGERSRQNVVLCGGLSAEDGMHY